MSEAVKRYVMDCHELGEVASFVLAADYDRLVEAASVATKELIGKYREALARSGVEHNDQWKYLLQLKALHLIGAEKGTVKDASV